VVSAKPIESPFFLDPSGRAADQRVLAGTGIRSLKLETRHWYAYSVNVWLDFLIEVSSSVMRSTVTSNWLMFTWKRFFPG
jgi:hypothetical protein